MPRRVSDCEFFVVKTFFGDEKNLLLKAEKKDHEPKSMWNFT